MSLLLASSARCVSENIQMSAGEIIPQSMAGSEKVLSSSSPSPSHTHPIIEFNLTHLISSTSRAMQKRIIILVCLLLLCIIIASTVVGYFNF
jgi:hypothetical protein